MRNSDELRGSILQDAGSEMMQKRPPGDDWEPGRSHHSKSTRIGYTTVAPQRIIGSEGNQGGALQQTSESISLEDAAAAYASQHNLLNALHIRMNSTESSLASSSGSDISLPFTSRESTPRPQEREDSADAVNSLLKATNKGKKRATEPCPLPRAERASFDYSTMNLPPWPNVQQSTVQNYVRSIQPEESPAPGLGSQIPPNMSSVPPQCPRSDDFLGLGQVMSHFSDGMDRLLTFVQRNQMSAQENLQKHIDAAVKELKGSFASTATESNTTGQTNQCEGSPEVLQFPLRKHHRAPKKRKHFIPSKPEQGNHMDEVRDSQEHQAFMKAIRSHTLILLRIKSYKYLNRIKCELSDEENNAFESYAPGAIKITPTMFMLDCSRVFNSDFNQTAASVFAEDFLDKVNNHSWYSKESVPIRYRETDTIIDAFKSHFAYIRTRYKQVIVAQREDPVRATEDRNARLQKASRLSRKTRLVKMRLSAMVDHPELCKHIPLVQQLGTQGVSSDESEREFPRTNIYPRIYPRWRSTKLAALMWQADVVSQENASIPMGTRKKSGCLLRSRPHTSEFNDDAAAPTGLPRNCYDQEWLATLPERIVQRLHIIDQDYNFRMTDVPSPEEEINEAEINEVEMSNPPPPAGTP